MNSSKVNAIVTNLLGQYLSEGAWTQARQLVTDERFEKCCQEDGSEILNMLMYHLTETDPAPPELIQTVEVLLKATAQYADAQDMIMEFLERLDHVKDDNVLITLMKGLKVVLLRQPERKSLSIEWCLKSLENYFKRLPSPQEMDGVFEVEKFAFLESNEKIDRILQLHLILLLFLEPLVKQVVEQRSEDYKTRTLEITRQNVLIHFLLNMLDTHLNRIYIPFLPGSETNTYIRQCRETLTNMLTELLGADPFFLLPFIERRIRYPIKVDEDARDSKKMNVFILPDKTSIVSYGHYYHTFLVHGLAPENTPKIYRRDYIFIKFLYLITEMIRSEDQHVQMKGLELGQKLLMVISGGELRSHEYLEMTVFETFFDRMIQIMTYSENAQIRKLAVKYTETLILSFDHCGRLIILENLFAQYADNKGLCGYLPLLYKNMVVEQLNRVGEKEPLPEQYTGKVFQKILLRHICSLSEGEKTNILESSDRILAALNMIRFIALRDRSDRTGFWSIRKELEDAFLEKLRLAIDYSRAHYLHYKKNVEAGVEVVAAENDVSLSMYGSEMPQLSKEQKLIAMDNCLNSFDLMDSLLARVNECIQAGRKEGC